MVIDVRWGSATHQGRVRDHNEDAVLAGPSVFAVADGMGGHAGGEVASAIAVARLSGLTGLHDVDDPDAELGRALDDANREIRRRAALDGAVEGMGTTIAGIVPIRNQAMLVFNLGDSRVYRARRGQLDQLTEDHSLVGELVRAGEITEDEARRHPHRNVVTRALGVEAHIAPMITHCPVDVGDCFVVASDGLFNELAHDEIAAIVATPGPLERRARALVDAALAGGGRDNVSVVLVAVASTSAEDGLDVDTSPSVPDRRRDDPVDARPIITAVPGPHAASSTPPGLRAAVRPGV